MRLTKILGATGALILSALVGGTLIGSALAADETDATGDAGAYCDTFMDTVAAELGVTRDALVDAGRAGANAAIDAALAAGDLSNERATALRDRVDAADGEHCGLLAPFRAGFAHGVTRGLLGGDVFAAAADALGMESSDLIGQLRDAGSLQALAEELGVSYDDVKASVLDSLSADLDAAVDEGLSQQRADAAIEHVTEWLDNGGEPGALRPHHGAPRPSGPWADGSGA
jgi:hypothetical protein